MNVLARDGLASTIWLGRAILQPRRWLNLACMPPKSITKEDFKEAVNAISKPPMEEIHPQSWVHELTGLQEYEWLKQRQPLSSKLCGKFEAVSLKELSERIVPNPNPQLVKFVIYSHSGNYTWVDTSSLQTSVWETSKPVMFQVASNFNAQENGSSETKFDSGHFLTGLMVDTTQGPSAAGGAGAGAIERLRIHLESPINLLENTVCRDKVKGGKLKFGNKALGEELVVSDIKVGLHTDVLAQFDRHERGKCMYTAEGRKIDQVFAATVLSPGASAAKLTEKLLHAAYHGTYQCATFRQTEVLVLTLVGGASFQNPMSMILAAIAKAHKDLSGCSYLKQVVLPLFDRTLNPEDIQNALIQGGIVRECIQLVEK